MLAPDGERDESGEWLTPTLMYAAPILLGAVCAALLAAPVLPRPAVWLGTVGTVGALLAPILGDDWGRVLPREGESALERLALALFGGLLASAAIGVPWGMLA